MGKSNRIRNERATKKAVAPVTKQKKGMPNWLLTTITLVVTVAILLTVVLGILSSNGVFLRMSTTMETENYKVTGNMLTYYFNSTFQSFYSNYSTYLSGSTKYFSLDITKDLKDQQFGTETYDSIFLGSFTGTWFDYFMEQTKDSVRQMLVYCEEADVRGIALDSEDLTNIDAEIKAIETYATLYNYPDANSYIAALFGEGVTKKDVRDAIELSTLATKCANAITEEFDNALPIDSDEVLNRYNENKTEFNEISYSYYTFSVDYDDAVTEVLGKDAKDDEITAHKAEIEAKYLEMVADVKAKAEALKACTTEEAFEKHIITTFVNENFQSVYDAEDIKDDLKPSAEVEAKIKDAIIAEVIELALADDHNAEEEATEDEDEEETDENADATLYGETVKAGYAEAMESVKEDLFDDTHTMSHSYFVEGAKFAETDFLKWAFETEENSGTRAPLDVKVITDGNDGTDEEKAIDDDSRYSETVYMLTKTQAPDEALTRNLGFASFTKKDDAQKFIDELKKQGETVTLDKFNSLAKEAAAIANDKLENYAKGEMGVAEFDNWAYSSDLVKGGYSTSPITLTTDSAYVVITYIDDGAETWKVTVKSTLLNEKIQKNYEDIAAKHAPVDYPKAINKINSYMGG